MNFPPENRAKDQLLKQGNIRSTYICRIPSSLLPRPPLRAALMLAAGSQTPPALLPRSVWAPQAWPLRGPLRRVGPPCTVPGPELSPLPGFLFPPWRPPTSSLLIWFFVVIQLHRQFCISGKKVRTGHLAIWGLS